MITLYNAIAGSCAEDKANAGGGGGGGGGGGLITLNGAYFSDSAVSGAQAGVNAYMFRNVSYTNTGGSGPPYPTVSMTGTFLTGLSSPTISLVAPDETKSEYTLPASTLISFLDAARIGQVDPVTGKVRREEVFFNIGCFLQTPTGLTTLNNYSIVSASTTWTGVFTNFAVASIVGTNWPLQDSLAISNTYPQPPFFFAQSTTGDWGVCGTGQLQVITSASSLSHIMLVDFRGNPPIQPQNNPSAGQTLTVKYRASIQNGSNQLEKNFHTVVITLT